jgi:TfoX/Sxy family transcriptional regulator of competence genes
MAFGPVLADRTSAELSRYLEFSEKKMFGGLAFLVNGNMCCGVSGSDLVLRLSPEAAERALRAPHTRPIDFTGKPMKSMICVGPEGIRSDPALRKWVSTAVEVARQLPAKATKAPRKKRHA